MESKVTSHVLDFRVMVATTTHRGRLKGAFTIQCQQPVVQKTVFFEREDLTGEYYLGAPEETDGELKQYAPVIEGFRALMDIIFEESGINLSMSVDEHLAHVGRKETPH